VTLNGVNSEDEFTQDDVLRVQQQLTNEYAQRMFQNFVDALRQNAKVKIVN